MTTLEIGVIRGDGIGPALVESALAVMTAAARRHDIVLEVFYEDAGAAEFERSGVALSAAGLERLRRFPAILKGPVGLPHVRNADGTEAGLLGGILRTGLDTYANVRPIKLYRGVRSPIGRHPGEVDYVIVRENTEGLYLSRSAGVSTHVAACDQLMITRAGTERICRYAFELARRRNGGPVDGRRRVTCVDKSNVLRSYWLFRTVFDEVAGDYPDVEADHLYADAAACALVERPQQFDVLVMENFLGDILSDLGAGTVGGLGMCASANVGDRHRYFEPIHGSAPSLAGTGQANPISQVMSGSLLFETTGHTGAARDIRTAISRALSEGIVSISDQGTPRGGTDAVTDALCELIDRGLEESDD